MVAPVYLCSLIMKKVSLLESARDFIDKIHSELTLPGAEERMSDIRKEFEATGTYRHLPHELEHGVKMAWRNSNRCIGRLFWKSLVVRDCRDVRDSPGVLNAMFEHLDKATNDGRILPMVTLFPPRRPDGIAPVRIWNKHLIRYACYKSPEGSFIGDPAQEEFTGLCLKMGWKGSGGAFDVLPLVIQCEREAPVLHEIPKEKVMEVELIHPELPWFRDLGLRWHALPLIADMMLEMGGIEYPAAPFNGWYMLTEIGSRNLGDENRYNMLPAVARKMGLSTDKSEVFWKDKALIVLNEAVLHSFKAAGVTLTDHHSASEQFMKFIRNEEMSNRKVTGDWSWLVPPMSGSALQVFHREYDDTIVSPNFHYSKDAWKCPFH